MDKFTKLRKERIVGIKFDTSKIVPDAKEVVFNLVSCMCDNKQRMQFKKVNGEFKVVLRAGEMLHALSNLQMQSGIDSISLSWAADEQKWEEIAEMIETGTSAIESVISR